MDVLTDLASKLAGINCPSCLHAALEVQMRCDLGFQDCIYVATCRHCRHAFEVNPQIDVMLDQSPVLQKRLRESGCPNCGSIKLHLSMRCEVTGSKECFYVATCDLCAYSFRLRGGTGPLPPLPN